MLASKKFILLGIVLGALIILGSVLTIQVILRQQNSPEVNRTPTASATPIEEPRVEDEYTLGEREAAFVLYVKLNAPTLANMPDEELLTSGRLICQSLDAGRTFQDIFTTGLNSGLSFDETTILIGTAVGAFCSHHKDALDG